MARAGGTEPRVPRVLILVCDSFGVGDAPDANTASAVGGIRAPNLGGLGLGLLTKVPGVDPEARPGTAHGRLTERSAGKDTTTGHWEMAGIVLTEPFPLYPNGFPAEIIEPFQQAVGRSCLSRTASIPVPEYSDRHRGRASTSNEPLREPSDGASRSFRFTIRRVLQKTAIRA